uniref:CHK kinase-like domain-containing protein n=1 Tax=Panagrolaimus davidi TaxID=227884 RepID=A0A914QRJ9_9BILA
MKGEKEICDVVDISKSIFGTSFTVEWLLDSLRQNDKVYQNLHGDRAVKDVTAYDVSGGKGFVSQVLRCTVTFVDSTNSAKDVYHTILKIPGMECLNEAKEKCDFDFDNYEKATNKDKYTFMTEIHKFECDFYKNLTTIIDVPCPKIFKTREWILKKQEGVIHMEDLTLRGKTLSFFENINLTQVKCVIRHLAHMHKNILSIDPEIWHGKYVKTQEALADYVLIPIMNKLRKFYMNRDFAIYSTKQAHLDLGMKSVIVHGDMHSGNIMWAINEEGDIQNEVAAFVDWQIMHEGSPMSDLARFLTHCCDGVVRRQSEVFAIEYYFECLTKEFGSKEKVPFTEEQLKKAYNYCFLTQAFYSIGVTELMFTANEDKISSESLKSAFYDFAVLKTLHLFEDADKLLQGEMKDVFEKYGV